MGIHGNGRLAESHAEHHVGGLPAHTRQAQEAFHILGHFRMEVFHQLPAQTQDIPGFGPEQAAVPDPVFQLFLGQGPQFFRGVQFREQPGGDLVHPFIGALGGEHHRHQQFKGGPIMEGRALAPVGLLQFLEDGPDPFFLSHQLVRLRTGAGIRPPRWMNTSGLKEFTAMMGA